MTQWEQNLATTAHSRMLYEQLKAKRHASVFLQVSDLCHFSQRGLQSKGSSLLPIADFLVPTSHE